MKSIFIGNLSFATSEPALESLFENYGAVQSVKVVTDQDTGRSRGFAFIEMRNDSEAEIAITALNGKSVDGKIVKVNEARRRGDRLVSNRTSSEKTAAAMNRSFYPLRVHEPQW